MAVYPNGIYAAPNLTDGVDVVVADHVNKLRAEMTAVQSTLGTNLTRAVNGVVWKSLSERLGNMESIVLRDDSLRYVRTSGNSTIKNGTLRLARDGNLTALAIGPAEGDTSTLRLTADGKVYAQDVRTPSLTVGDVKVSNKSIVLNKHSITSSGATLASGNARLEVANDRVRITGGLEVPDEPTYVWTAPSTVWLGTRPKISGLSNVRPTYWDNLYSAANEDAQFAMLGGVIYGPKSGNAKITIRGEVSGNVSRSSLSFGVYDMTTKIWALDFSSLQGISINAPIASTPEDTFYTSATNFAIVKLTPGVPYAVFVKGHRAIPGSDAAGPYFPGHWNYDARYPWGRFFPVHDLQIISEPVFGRTRAIDV